MISIRNLLSLAKVVKLQPKIIASSSNQWKDRDQASEKVYISRTEKETMKKLLKKIEIEEEDMESNLEEFERRLRQVMKRYKIQNQTLAKEITNLHKQSTS